MIDYVRPINSELKSVIIGIFSIIDLDYAFKYFINTLIRIVATEDRQRVSAALSADCES